jgi:hypothetical protein
VEFKSKVANSRVREWFGAFRKRKAIVSLKKEALK